MGTNILKMTENEMLMNLIEMDEWEMPEITDETKDNLCDEEY